MRIDDSKSFLPQYLEYEIIKSNPYAANDELGVGEMIMFSSESGHTTRKDLKIGICGEHDGKSIKLCNKKGLSYVSCLSNRARLAAAQAILE